MRLILFLLACACAAQDLPSAARDLARKILAKAPADTITLSVKNNSTLDAAQAASVRNTLERETARRGSRVTDVQVTLSETLRSYVWAADIRRGEERETAIVSIPRLAPPVESASAGAFVIDKKLIWEQQQPMLDVYAADGMTLVLEPSGVSVYEGGQLRAALPAPEPRPVTRDPRGMLAISEDTFRAALPGVLCRGVWRPLPVMQCSASAEPWPLAGGPATLAEGKNYFTRGTMPPFYSSAISGASGASFWVQASIDGRAQIFDAASTAVSSVSGWGSDMASAATSCGEPPAILVTQAGSLAEPDAIQPFRIASGRAVPAGDRVEFGGPVTALWSQPDGSVLAVIHNLKTRRYAAYTLAITCGH